MSAPRLWLAVLALSAALVPSQAAAQAETFHFPQVHDSTFGDQLGIPPLGRFDWWLEGQGVRGRRTTSNIEVLQAFGFNLVFGQESCFGFGTSMFLDVYVNDRHVGSEPLPPPPGNCNFPLPPIQKVYDLTANPIAGLGNGREFEVRFQIRGTMMLLGGYYTFYRIDPGASQVSFAGTLTDDGGDDDDPPPPPPPPVDEHGNVIARIGQAETNLSGQISSDGTTTRTALQSVRDALGIVEDNIEASIAGAVLRVNSETALGISNLAAQLGVQSQDLAFAIKGNGTAIEKVQQSIEAKLLPEILKGQDLTQITQAKVDQVGNNFLGQVLSAGTGVLGFFSGGALLPVAGFVQNAIMEVVNGKLRPDRIVKKAMAEFNRGLKRVKKLFSMSGPAFSLPWERHAVEAITLGFAADTVDIPEFPADPAMEKLLGPDREEDTAYGAYLWFQRAYQTLVRPEDKHLQHDGDCRDPRHHHYDKDRDDWERERREWEKKKQDWDRDRSNWERDKDNWEREKKDLEKKTKGR